jgi:hypothetical protein
MDGEQVAQVLREEAKELGRPKRPKVATAKAAKAPRVEKENA